jgi:isoquinoline 1-oxidoreductase beta subunit
VINPDTVMAQVEGGIVYGLSAALYGQVRIAGGRAVESNFHDYRVLRLPSMPAIETVLIDSHASPGGAGEPSTPPIAPAVCNALRALRGQPVRRLPIAV